MTVTAIFEPILTDSAYPGTDPGADLSCLAEAGGQHPLPCLHPTDIFAAMCMQAGPNCLQAISFPPRPSASTFHNPHRVIPSVGSKQAAMAIPTPYSLSARKPLHLGMFPTLNLGNFSQIKRACDGGLRLFFVDQHFDPILRNTFKTGALKDSVQLQSFQKLCISALDLSGTRAIISACNPSSLLIVLLQSILLLCFFLIQRLHFCFFA